MEAEARYTWVGAAVLGLLAAMVASMVWLKNVGGESDLNRYAIHFQRQALDGLEIGAAVTLRGIKVGRVEDYALAGDRLDSVRVEIRVDRRAPAFTNTVALVTRNFVTGIAQITLVNGDPPGQLLVKIPVGEQYPVIGEGRSDLQEIAGRVNEVGQIATAALTNVNELLSAENRTTVIAAIDSIRELSSGLNKRLDTLDATMRQVGGAATSLGDAASQFGSAASRLGQSGEQIAAVVDRGVLRLDATFAATERAMAEAQLTFSRIAVASDALQQQAVATAQRLEVSAASVDDQLGATLAELRLSIDTATRVFDRLREPRSALLGPDKSQLGPGEKMP